MGETVVLPLVGCDPDQLPPAVQLVALVLDQDNVELAPDWICVGLAVRVTVGAAGAVTATVALAWAVPPVPVQLRMYVDVPVGVTLVLPLVDSEPDQLPLAVQVVALVLDQDSVELAPDWICVGLAVRVTVGATGAVTLTVALAWAAPPAPVQLRV